MDLRTGQFFLFANWSYRASKLNQLKGTVKKTQKELVTGLRLSLSFKFHLTAQSERNVAADGSA